MEFDLYQELEIAGKMLAKIEKQENIILDNIKVKPELGKILTELIPLKERVQAHYKELELQLHNGVA